MTTGEMLFTIDTLTDRLKAQVASAREAQGLHFDEANLTRLATEDALAAIDTSRHLMEMCTKLASRYQNNASQRKFT